MIRMNADVKDFKKVIKLASKKDGDMCIRDLETGELVTNQIFGSIENFYFGNSETKTSIEDRSGSFAVAKTFAGKIYDGIKTECLIVRTKKELDDFTSKWILKSHPKFMPGARKIVGHTPSKDPLTGKSKIDFDKFSLVFVFGQRTVAHVSLSGRNVLVYWRYDWTKRTSNSYGAALVPAIPSGLQVNLRWMLIAPPLSSFRIGLRPMTSSHPIRRRVTGPPMTGRKGPPRKGPPRTQALLDARRKKMRQAAAAAAPAKRKHIALRRSARIAALNKQRHNSR